MEVLKELFPYLVTMLGSSAVTMFIQQFFTRGKTKAETKKITVDADVAVSGILLKFNEDLRNDIQRLQKDIERLTIDHEQCQLDYVKAMKEITDLKVAFNKGANAMNPV